MHKLQVYCQLWVTLVAVSGQLCGGIFDLCYVYVASAIRSDFGHSSPDLNLGGDDIYIQFHQVLGLRNAFFCILLNIIKIYMFCEFYYACAEYLWRMLLNRVIWTRECGQCASTMQNRVKWCGYSGRVGRSDSGGCRRRIMIRVWFVQDDAAVGCRGDGRQKPNAQAGWRAGQFGGLLLKGLLSNQSGFGVYAATTAASATY